jgi:CRP-like cAMP-binding protein
LRSWAALTTLPLIPMAAVTPQIELLSSARLRMGADIWRRRPEHDAVILRAKRGDRRLVITPAQESILTDGFSTGCSVPEVLVRMIAENRCPPLREFYELVLQAHAARILMEQPETLPTVPDAAARWPIRVGPRTGVWLGGVGMALAAIVLAVRLPHWQGPTNTMDVVAGWLVACGLLSFGHLLAACVVAGCGEVRGTRFYWLTRFPHYRIDSGEAIMGGRSCELAVAFLRAWPVLTGAAVAAWNNSHWLAGLCGGAIYCLAPFGESAARQALASRRKTPRHSVRADFLFAPVSADLWLQWSARIRAFWLEFGWLGFGWTVIWFAWLGAAITRCMPGTVAMVEAWRNGMAGPVDLGAEYLLLAALSIGLLAWAWVGIKHFLLKRAWSRPMSGADARDRDRPGLAGNNVEILGRVALFEALDPASRGAIADAMETMEVEPGHVVVREDEAGDEFFVIVAGEAEIRKRIPMKRGLVTIGWMGAGDCFGEIALLEKTTRTATVVARSPLRLLKLGREPFERLIAERIGAERIKELLQYARFLGRLTFASGWSFRELVKFAQRCRTRRADAGSAILTKGESNHWFHLLYDGVCEARDGTRMLRRMHPGDYFGEISLLEGGEATATVIALEECRYLVLGRRDFLELFARDFRIGLRVESIARKRLGSTVFSP